MSRYFSFGTFYKKSSLPVSTADLNDKEYIPITSTPISQINENNENNENDENNENVESNENNKSNMTTVTIDAINQINQANETNQTYEDYKLKENERGTFLLHLHRAEVGRLATYRVRLDTSISWAVSILGLFSTYTINQETIPHYFFVIIFLIITFFLLIESKRYLLYDFMRNRVRKYEKHVVSQIFSKTNTNQITSNEWSSDLSDLYQNIKPLIPLYRSIFLRFTRIYVYLYIIIYCAWFLKYIISQSYEIYFFRIFSSVYFALLFLLYLIGIRLTRDINYELDI